MSWNVIIWPENTFGIYLEVTFELTIVDGIHITLLVLGGVGGKGGWGGLMMREAGRWTGRGVGGC